MASSSQPILILLISLSILLISPAQSQTCKSPIKNYAQCTDLPVLSASLHWTYNAANGNLTVAFTAPPPNSNGWVAWAINPTGTGMAGAQAFVASRLPNGSVPVTTFNISSYSSIVPSSLSFTVYESRAEYSGGRITIFAVVKAPALKAGSLNHIWQVGPGFNTTNGWLLRHDFKPENLNAVGTLHLGSKPSADSAAPSASPSGSPSSPAPSPVNGKNGVVSVTVSFGNLVLYALFSLLVLVVSL